MTNPIKVRTLEYWPEDSSLRLASPTELSPVVAVVEDVTAIGLLSNAPVMRDFIERFLASTQDIQAGMANTASLRSEAQAILRSTR